MVVCVNDYAERHGISFVDSLANKGLDFVEECYDAEHTLSLETALDDLSKAIYNRYFEFAEDLERRAKGHPNFQYIITTTEPPPERFRKGPYLRLQLDASRPEDRFLKCDL